MKFALSLVFSLYTFILAAQQMNGFDLSNTAIPVGQILSGGPPRDGIPSIDNPNFEPINKSREFSKSSEVLGVYYYGIAKAYPINILDWHEIVNDDFNGKPVVITYCPLCGSGIAFNAVQDTKPLEFGVSGLLYNSDVLLYDRSTNSLWSQIMAESISGPMKGRQLELIRTQRMSLGSWQKLHPESLVLTTATGLGRNYQISPYGNYEDEDHTYFPLTHNDDRFHKKEWIIGIEINSRFKAYPLKALARLKDPKLQDELSGTAYTMSWDRHGENILIETVTGEEIIGLQMYWFAWAAFHPDTEVFDE